MMKELAQLIQYSYMIFISFDMFVLDTYIDHNNFKDLSSLSTGTSEYISGRKAPTPFAFGVMKSIVLRAIKLSTMVMMCQLFLIP